MAGITDADFLIKVIPYGFDVVTLGGFNLDAKTIEASKQILDRGRNEFYFPEDEIFNHIENEVSSIKKFNSDILVSVNLRSTTPEPIIESSKIDNLDIVEINCHCRQPEFLNISCGQNMLLNPNLEDFIRETVNKSDSKVSVKIRANVDNVDYLQLVKMMEDVGVDYIHIDAMNPGILDADYDFLEFICSNTNVPIIGNNSINNRIQIEKMLNTGVSGFSIGRALISGKLDFNIADF